MMTVCVYLNNGINKLNIGEVREKTNEMQQLEVYF